MSNLRSFAKMSKVERLKSLIEDKKWDAILMVEAPIEYFDWCENIWDMNEVVIDHLNSIMPVPDKVLMTAKFNVRCNVHEIDLSLVGPDAIIERIVTSYPDTLVKELIAQGVADRVFLSRPMTCELAERLHSLNISEYVRKRVDDVLHWRTYIHMKDCLAEVIANQMIDDPDIVADVLMECVNNGYWYLLDRIVVFDGATPETLIDLFHHINEDMVDLFAICLSYRYRCSIDDLVMSVCSKGFIECFDRAFREDHVTPVKMLMACAYCDDDVKRAKMMNRFKDVVLEEDVIKCIRNGNMRPLIRLREFVPRMNPANVSPDDVAAMLAKVIVPHLSGVDVRYRYTVISFYGALGDYGVKEELAARVSLVMTGLRVNNNGDNDDWAAAYVGRLWSNASQSDRDVIRATILSLNDGKFGLLCTPPGACRILEAVKDVHNFSEVANLLR